MDNMELENGRGRMYSTEMNNNIYSDKMQYHDPWTRGHANEQQSFIENDKVGGKIYKPGREGSSSSTTKLTSVLKRKQSVYHQDLTPGKASFAISVFNLMNAILGSGILGLPYAMAQLGMVLFFIFEVIVAFLALYAIRLLLILCDQTNVKAYEKLGFIAFGLPGRIIAACCILLQNIGAMCSYLFIVKYELPNVIMTIVGVTESDGSWYYDGDILVVVVTCCIIMPLASLKNIGFLGYTSGFSISCMFFFTAVVIAKKFSIGCPLFDQAIFENATHSEHDIDHMTEEKAINDSDIVSTSNNTLDIVFNTVTETMIGKSELGNDTDSGYVLSPIERKALVLYEEFGPQTCKAEAFGLTDKWAYSIPTMTFSFVCHTAVLPIYAELKKPSASRMQKVSNTSISICFILYSLSALFGYLTFYNWVEPELLLMYSYVDSADVMTLIVRLCVLIAVVLTVPLTHFPARKAVTFLLFPNKGFSWVIHLGIMFGLLTLINLLVIFVPTIREVFGIIGATASTMLVFILPCIFFIRIDEKPLKSPQKIAALCLFILGICVMVQSLTVIILGYTSD